MRRFPVLLFCIALGSPAVMRAQNSPIVDLLLRSRVALNDLHYGEADSLAATLLTAFGDRLTRDQRIDALGVRAASAYPDPAGGGTQRAESAMVYLRQIVRDDPALLRPRQDISWSGLDSLFAATRHGVFAATARPLPEYVLAGPAGDAHVDAFATRPARFALSVRAAAGGSVLFADTAGPGERVALRLRGFAGERPFDAGNYLVEIVARDTATTDTLTMRYPMTVSGPALILATVPRAIDSTRLRPEIAPPARIRGILAGLLLGGSAMAASLARGPEPLASASADSRAFLLGGGMAIGAIIGGMMDRGRRLPENVAANARLRAAFAESAQQAVAENRRRIAAHPVTLTFPGVER